MGKTVTVKRPGGRHATKPLTRLMHDLEVDALVADHTTVHPQLLDSEFIELPANTAYWGERYALSLNAYLAAYAERKRVHGFLVTDPTWLEALDARLGKRANQAQVEGAVLNEPSYKDAVVDERVAEVELARVKSVLRALEAKKSALTSMGADTRIEREREPVIRERRRSFGDDDDEI